jgi:membrane protein DedA with SNARE-associated domain
VTEFLTQFIVDTILRYGLLAVFVLMVLESACIPIPSEVTMLFGGALTNSVFVASVTDNGTPLNFVAVAMAGAIGNLVGSWIAWGVGYAGGRPLIERWGRFIFLRPHELDRAEVWFDRHGQTAVFVSRLLPVVRTFISLPAGVAEMPLGRFSLYTFLGCLPWTFALAALGYALGSQWHVVDRFLRPISIVIAVLVAVAAGWWLYRRWKEQQRLDAAAAEEAEEEPAADRR